MISNLLKVRLIYTTSCILVCCGTMCLKFLLHINLYFYEEQNGLVEHLLDPAMYFCQRFCVVLESSMGRVIHINLFL